MTLRPVVKITSDGTPHNVSLVLECPDGPVDLTALGIVEEVDVHIDKDGNRVRFKVSFTGADFWPRIAISKEAELPKGLDEVARAFGYLPGKGES